MKMGYFLFSIFAAIIVPLAALSQKPEGQNITGRSNTTVHHASNFTIPISVNSFVNTTSAASHVKKNVSSVAKTTMKRALPLLSRQLTKKKYSGKPVPLISIVGKPVPKKRRVEKKTTKKAKTHKKKGKNHVQQRRMRKKLKYQRRMSKKVIWKTRKTKKATKKTKKTKKMTKKATLHSKTKTKAITHRKTKATQKMTNSLLKHQISQKPLFKLKQKSTKNTKRRLENQTTIHVTPEKTTKTKTTTRTAPTKKLIKRKAPSHRKKRKGKKGKKRHHKKSKKHKKQSTNVVLMVKNRWAGHRRTTARETPMPFKKIHRQSWHRLHPEEAKEERERQIKMQEALQRYREHHWHNPGEEDDYYN